MPPSVRTVFVVLFVLNVLVWYGAIDRRGKDVDVLAKEKEVSGSS
jgi:hypothetical protein